MVAGPRREGLERGPLPRSERISAVIGHSRAAGPEDAVEVGREQRGRIGVGLVELDQLTIEAHRVEHGRILVGDRGVGLGLPGDKLVPGAEGRARREQFECVLGRDESAFA